MAQFFQDDGESGEKKVCLATTVYENPSAAYTFSIQRSREALHRAGFKTAYYLLSGNCHVDDARNSVVQEFLLSDCADLVFLDADVCWEPEALVRLCQFDADVVGGVYPYRRDDEQSASNMPVVLYPGEQTVNGLMEVAGLPSGFMRIRRHVLEKLYAGADKYWNRTDRRKQVGILFERTYHEGLRLGGDLSFCKKWVEAGGKVYAAVDLHLGHVAKSIVYDSLGAYLRRQNGETLHHLVQKVREGLDLQSLTEARKALGNNAYSAMEDVLSVCVLLGKKAQGPVIEAGSGLSSVVLGAATSNQVFCLEHDEAWASRTEKMIRDAGLTNSHVIRCDIKDGWYDIPKSLPGDFALGLNDGPPRTLGSRMGFFDHFGSVPSIICDDADDRGYGDALAHWCKERGRRIDFIQRAAVIR